VPHPNPMGQGARSYASDITLASMSSFAPGRVDLQSAAGSEISLDEPILPLAVNHYAVECPFATGVESSECASIKEMRDRGE